MSFFKKAKVETVSSELAYSGWNKLYRLEIDYTSSRGETFRLPREVMDHGSAVAILLYDAERDIVVLVRQFRIATQHAGLPPFVLEIPAGLLDGDAPEEAIRRETLEETGYAVGDLRFLFQTIASPGALTETIHIYAARVSLAARVHDGGGLEEEHEDIEIVEMRLDDAYAAIASGEIIDAKTIMALQWAMLHRDKL
ncbi:NUDIX domain-containing protein [Rhizobium sp. L1K21]|uniref:NUDIX domain-containing protein n=1 Tax=Rhizobium sp. L1K21 TaxID=2954933 RepID=UPI00209288C2|nr:NUDIX domain-containing protein [Rhizobium sp. L1K21]MCO6186486.1 NUDIX domain-containing protein [Rhizobium sp. L1K21]